MVGETKNWRGWVDLGAGEEETQTGVIDPHCGTGLEGDGRPFDSARQVRMRKQIRDLFLEDLLENLETASSWKQLAVLKLAASCNVRDLFCRDPSLSTAGIWGGPSCALQEVEQHPWPLLTRRQ